MKKVLLVLLIALLPLQSVWAAGGCVVLAKYSSVDLSVGLNDISDVHEQDMAGLYEQGCGLLCTTVCDLPQFDTSSRMKEDFLRPISLPVPPFAPPLYQSPVFDSPIRPK